MGQLLYDVYKKLLPPPKKYIHRPSKSQKHSTENGSVGIIKWLVWDHNTKCKYLRRKKSVIQNGSTKDNDGEEESQSLINY